MTYDKCLLGICVFLNTLETEMIFDYYSLQVWFALGCKMYADDIDLCTSERPSKKASH